MTLRSDAPAFRVDAEHGLWGGRRLWDLYDEGKTPLEWHRPLFERARTRGILCFSTPFDEKAVDFLEEFEPPAYKIASFECIDLPLIRYVASTRRPLILSTGMASLGEIERAVETARAAGCEQLVLLKCTSTYPADPVDTNLRAIPLLRECFGCEVGLSDHTGGVGAAVAAVALGATFIEKHFTISRAAGGVDAAFSLEPPELRALVVETERAWQALGTPRVGPTRAELASSSRGTFARESPSHARTSGACARRMASIRSSSSRFSDGSRAGTSLPGLPSSGPWSEVRAQTVTRARPEAAGLLPATTTSGKSPRGTLQATQRRR
jgi:N-acetylneuraminate synthase